MTYKEKLMKERPEWVNDDEYLGGCRGCPCDIVEGGPALNSKDCLGCAPEHCEKCWNKEIPEPEKKELPADILKIIDDAMAKKDRRVYILITPSGTSVSVTPLVEGEKE